MAAEHTDKTTIELAGKIDASLGTATAQAVGSLERIQKAALNTGQKLEALSQKLSTSLVSGTKGLTTKMIGLVGAAAAAAAGFSSLKGFIESAMEAAKEEKNLLTAGRLKRALENNLYLRQQGAKVLDQEYERITQIAEKMHEQSAIGANVYKSAFATLAQFGATSKEIKAIAPAMADYLASTTGVATSMEDANNLAMKLTAAITTHKLGRFARELGITPEQQKQWKNLHSNMERALFLAQKIEEHRKGAAAAQAASATGQLALAEQNQAEIMAKYGDVFNRIKSKWLGATTEMMNAALPWAVPMVQEAGKRFDELIANIKKGWAELAKDKTFWNEWNKDVAAFQQTVKPITDFFQEQFTAENLKKGWQEFMADLEADMGTINAIVGMFQKMKEFGDWLEAKGKEMRAGPGTAAQRLETAQGRLSEAVAHGLRAGDPEYERLNRAVLEAEQDLKHESLKREDNTRKLELGTKANEAATKASEALSKTIDGLNEAMGQFGQWMFSTPAGKGGNYGLHGSLSDVPGAVYEQYKDEGSAARYGAYRHMDLFRDPDTEIGAGVAYRAARGLKLGDWVEDPNHPELGKRQIRETSERPHGVEFATRRSEQGRYSKLKNIELRKTTPPPGASAGPASGHTIQYSPVIHIGRLDKASLAELHTKLIDHSRDLINRLQDADREDYRTSFS